MNNRQSVRCNKCGSLERGRSFKLLLDYHKIPKPGANILHFAPERGMSGWLNTTNANHYDAVDLDPNRYPHANVRAFDASKDCETLEENYYDLIIHSHILEHIPCNIAYVLYHISRALKPDGFHVFCVPLMRGYYGEDLAPLSKEEATKRFGQFDHLRRFGKLDMERHLGSIMNIDLDYSLYKTHSKEELDAVNIPESEREGLMGSTIFVTRKHDYKLQPTVKTFRD